MRFLLLHLALSVLLVLVAGAAPADDGEPPATTRSFKGIAYDRKTGALLYTEEYQQSWSGERLVSTRVSYRDPSGKEIATKTLDFAKGIERPTFQFDDLRDGYQQGVVVNADRIELYVREAGGEPVERTRIDTPPDLVVDAGFNYFIREHWLPIVSGETLSFAFAAPARRDTYRFQVEKSGDRSTRGRPSMVVTVELANPVLRWLIDPITLVYDCETRELLEWQGISNLDDANDVPYDARIEFPRGEGGIAAAPDAAPAPAAAKSDAPSGG